MELYLYNLRNNHRRPIIIIYFNNNYFFSHNNKTKTNYDPLYQLREAAKIFPVSFAVEH